MGDKIRNEQKELRNQLKTLMKEHEALPTKMVLFFSFLFCSCIAFVNQIQ